jgi:hypothetical protein
MHDRAVSHISADMPSQAVTYTMDRCVLSSMSNKYELMEISSTMSPPADRLGAQPLIGVFSSSRLSSASLGAWVIKARWINEE